MWVNEDCVHPTTLPRVSPERDVVNVVEYVVAFPKEGRDLSKERMGLIKWLQEQFGIYKTNTPLIEQCLGTLQRVQFSSLDIHFEDIDSLDSVVGTKSIQRTRLDGNL